MPLHKKTVSGSVSDTLTYTVETKDAYGAQIRDVIFFDELGAPVEPSDGQYVIEWSANGKHWNLFEGAYFPARVSQPVEDWQASGYIEHVRVVPIGITGATSWSVLFRFHGIGMPSVTARSMSANRYFSAINTVQVDGFQQSVLQGNALSASRLISIPPMSTYSMKIVNNVNAVVAYVYANGVDISFKDGNPTGEIEDLAGGGKLNTLESFEFHMSLEFYNGESTGERVVTSSGRLEIPVIINGGGSFELINNGGSDIETYVSVGQASLSAPKIPFILIPSTGLIDSTEMGDYNG